MGEMQLSAVALLDVLGFKNIERRGDPTIAASALQSARRTMGQAAQFATNWGSVGYIHRFNEPPTVKRAWFSDSIILVVQQPEHFQGKGLDSSEVAADLVGVAAYCAGYMLRAAAQEPLPLAFRGVVTLGRALVEGDDIFFGEAIAEASDLYETANGAFVWLSPKAAAARAFQEDRRGALVRYSVPLKGGQSIETFVVNPYIDLLPTASPGTTVRAGIVTAMTHERVDITIKRQNTLRFLDQVAKDYMPLAVREQNEEDP